MTFLSCQVTASPYSQLSGHVTSDFSCDWPIVLVLCCHWQNEANINWL